MANLDPIYGIHAQALQVQHKRLEVLSANIANADTPNYQAHDIDFAKVLSDVGKTTPTVGRPGVQTLTTDPRHLPISVQPLSELDPRNLPYRVQTQPSVDKNSVDLQVEQGKFADAALHYQAALGFANGGIKTFLTAITGQS